MLKYPQAFREVSQQILYIQRRHSRNGICCSGWNPGRIENHKHQPIRSHFFIPRGRRGCPGNFKPSEKIMFYQDYFIYVN